ncbi:hypothetical protein DL89DRAFT_68030 [Linderina pennispora]|uniref:C2H2-type domain-containing protein n=1 Tax=Linderina pennispora TaxID=61395 RepID=A0A1Y1VZH6_9FUNG|nr:uncharacterized protein DL89DRAFT_68030 [Linderina pennispora]ORX66254.1 hypothetical protein DL89DRAFT_68030 [Linderina pennispora]
MKYKRPIKCLNQSFFGQSTFNIGVPFGILSFILSIAKAPSHQHTSYQAQSCCIRIHFPKHAHTVIYHVTTSAMSRFNSRSRFSHALLACQMTIWKCSVCGACFDSEPEVQEHFAAEHLFAPLDEFM